MTTEWHDNGAKKGEGATLAGIQVGKWSYWREDGSLLRSGSYSRGTPTGIWRHSTPSGEVIGVDAETCAPEQVTWHSRSPLTPGDGPSQGWLLAGGRSGPWTHWRADGSLLSEGSYRRGQRTGHWRHFHSDGSLEREGDYEDGERRGLWTFFSPGGVQITQQFTPALQPDVRWAPRHPDPDGKLQVEGWIVGGKRCGYWRSWWPDGGRESEGEYLDGERIGEWNFRDEQGAIESTGRFSKGEREGRWTYTSPAGGELVLDDSYASDVRVEWCDGTSSEQDGTGWLVDGARQGHWDHPTTEATAGSSGEYQRGSKHGCWEHYWPDGGLRSTGSYHEGTQRGEWVYRSPTGAQVSVELSGPTPEEPVWHERAVLGDDTEESEGWVLADQREGPWTFWHPEGAKSCEGSFIAGRREGTWTFFGPNSNRIAAGSFAGGERHGSWELFYPSEVLRARGEYSKGRRSGCWEQWREDGTGRAVGSYEDGKPKGHWLFLSREDGARGDLQGLLGKGGSQPNQSSTGPAQRRGTAPAVQQPKAADSKPPAAPRTTSQTGRRRRLKWRRRPPASGSGDPPAPDQDPGATRSTAAPDRGRARGRRESGGRLASSSAAAGRRSSRRRSPVRAGRSSASGTISWKRILLFVLLTYVATFLAAFPFGFLEGYLTSRGDEVPSWLPAGMAVASLLSMLGVFTTLAFVQRSRTVVHVVAVALLAWLTSYPVNVALIGQPAAEWAASGIIVALLAAVGLGGCMLFRACVGSTDDPPGTEPPPRLPADRASAKAPERHGDSPDSPPALPRSRGFVPSLCRELTRTKNFRSLTRFEEDLGHDSREPAASPIPRLRELEKTCEAVLVRSFGGLQILVILRATPAGTARIPEAAILAAIPECMEHRYSISGTAMPVAIYTLLIHDGEPPSTWDSDVRSLTQALPSRRKVVSAALTLDSEALAIDDLTGQQKRSARRVLQPAVDALRHPSRRGARQEKLDEREIGQRAPLATFGLTAFLLLVYLCCLALMGGPDHRLAGFSPDSLVRLGGSIPTLTAGDLQLTRLFSAIALHADLMHLAGNALCLLTVGRWVERVFGWQWLAIGFLVTGFMGSLLSLAMAPPMVVSVGASGAIMGLIPICLVALSRLPDSNLKFGEMMWATTVFAYSIFDAFAGKEGIDHAGHIGGAISGSLMALLLWGVSRNRPQPLLTLALQILSALGLGLFAIITAMNLQF